jgi:phosphoglycolate phosphatase-like HAD superfamily hydrolase
VLARAGGELKEYLGLFFDFDGVLADSVEVKTTAFARLFESFGPEIVAPVVEYHRRHGGMTRFEKFRYYYAELLRKPLPEDELAALNRRFSQLVVDEIVAAPEIAGSVAFLEQWSSRVPCFIVSAAPEDELREIVRRRGLSRYFQEVVGAPASKKDNLAGLLAKYQLTAGDCLFFGDATSDYRASRDCGVDFLAILPDAEAPLLKQVPEVKWVRDFTGLRI